MGYNDQLRRQIYTVERDVTVAIDDFTRLDALLADLLRQPTTKVTSIVFDSSKEMQLQSEARSRAVADAQVKARQLAKLVGRKLGKAAVTLGGENQTPFVTSVTPIVGVIDNRASSGVAKRRGRDHRRHLREGTASVLTAGVVQPAAAAVEKGTGKEHNAVAPGKPFALGLIQITAEVEIDFQLVD